MSLRGCVVVNLRGVGGGEGIDIIKIHFIYAQSFKEHIKIIFKRKTT